MNECKLKIGDVVWRMYGHKKDPGEKTEWHAKPMCIEYIDDHKFLDAWRCGGSLGLIGKSYFLTREECLKNWEEHRHEYENPAVTSGVLHERERLGSIVKDDTYFWKDDDILRVYMNGMPVEYDKLPWREDDKPGEYGMPDCYVTLGMIRGAFGEYAILTVWYEMPTHGFIYQTGNYHNETAWRLHGWTQGYA